MRSPTTPTTEYSLSILGVSYTIKSRTILRNISLYCGGGNILALLGNSGSGKTSLLDVVACRAEGRTVGGAFINGRLVTPELFVKRGAYVLQDDQLLAHLTVKETLTYTARLKFAGATKNIQVTQRVEQVLNEIGLKHVADSKVGGAFKRGISGGEKRRVSIGCQLLCDPVVLLLDEPTTGLDSFTANRLVTNLSQLAKQYNKVIVMTIHQPRSDIFRLFDHIGILSLGELVYMGPSSQLVSYFTDLGYSCPHYANPLDHYVDLASVDRRDIVRESNTTARVRSLHGSYLNSNIFKDTLSEVHRSAATASDLEVESIFSNPWTYLDPPGFAATWATLFSRMTVNLIRDKPSLLMRIFQFSCFSFFLWLFIIRLKKNQESMQDRNGLFHQLVSVPPYVGVLNAVALFPTLRTTFRRESKDGLYGSTVFLFAYFVHILPFHLISTFIFTAVVHWGIGLQSEMFRFGRVWAVILLLHFSGEVLAVALMGVFKNEAVANSISGKRDSKQTNFPYYRIFLLFTSRIQVKYFIALILFCLSTNFTFH
ncbi:DgyrCDS2620 [Dimorphilus gyrociliatus]|uniref:DgyrCDS2620 n=1 Tax=Dimorphilus gyrociliatus TaxID=2664684 RepID=A0A7I8VCM4_9ANNE|nr:DgyrCDS2620 [Dimorphilus gyrociliatus]